MKASNQNVSEEDIERDYPAFAKNLQWTLLKNRLAKRYDIEITHEEVEAAFRQRVAEYFGGYGQPQMIDATVERLMQDQKQVNEIAEDILVDKLHHKIVAEVNIEPKPIGRDEFMEILTEARESAQAAQAPVVESDEEE